MFLLGYLPTHNCVYLADKDLHVYGYALSLSLVEYQSAVLRGDMDAAAAILPNVPKDICQGQLRELHNIVSDELVPFLMCSWFAKSVHNAHLVFGIVPRSCIVSSSTV